MQIKDYINLLLKRGWIIVLVAAATFAGAVLVSKLQTPIFRSTIKISVAPARSDYGLSLTIERVLRNYAAQIKTRKMAQTVIDKLKLDVTPETFLGELTISAQLDNNLIQVDVDDPDPNRAQFIANTLARVFVEDQTAKQADIDRQNRLDVSILDDALPGELNRPKTRKQRPGRRHPGCAAGRPHRLRAGVPGRHAQDRRGRGPLRRPHHPGGHPHGAPPARTAAAAASPASGQPGERGTKELSRPHPPPR